MREIINNKIYDTERAEKIVEFRRKIPVTTLFGEDSEMWVDCELYKTKKGSWFEVVGVNVRGTFIKAIWEEGAKERMRFHPDIYQEHFNDTEEA